MANVRGILKRCKAVRNIRAVTRTMEMAAVAQFQRVRQMTEGARPAAEQIERMLTDLAPVLAETDHPFLRGGSGNTCALIIVTSDRGLCGGYNNVVMGVARGAAADILGKGRVVSPYVIGRRGAALIRRDQSKDPEAPIPKPYKTYDGYHQSHLHEHVAELAEELMARVTTGELAAAYVAYARMVGGVAEGQVATLAPLVPREPAEKPDRDEYDFFPSAEAIIEKLIPMAIWMRLLKCFCESLTAEHASRMTAMRAATSNAEDMISDLTRQARRARRERITAELAEILAGAEAVV